MPITTNDFGTLQGRNITEFILNNGNGMRANIINYGGIITQLHVPGRHMSTDVVLGHQGLQCYVKDNAYLGAIIGRFANRIADGKFKIDGVTRDLDINDPPNHLHGGFKGFHCAIWESDAYTEDDNLCLRLHRIAPDGEGGYPGNLDITVIYRVTKDNALSFEVSATTDLPTPVSVAQHSYFNLAGHDSGDIGGHILQIHATQMTPVDNNLIPTGELLPVKDTPYDFTSPTPIGPRQRAAGGGFDRNFVVAGEPGTLRPAATLLEPQSGRIMNVTTTTPGMHFYDGAKLAVHPLCGKGSTEYSGSGGLCLETQHFPNSVNQANFPSPILRPGEKYEHQTIYAFDVE